MTFGSKLKAWEGEECHMCGSPLLGESAHYDDKYFCDDTCLGKYLVEKFDDDIEWLNIVPKEDLETAEKEGWFE